VQFLLDTAGSVDEVLQLAQRTRPTVATKQHFLICDASSDCAVLEYLGGELRVHRGASLPFVALANSPYAASLAHLQDRLSAEGHE